MPSVGQTFSVPLNSDVSPSSLSLKTSQIAPYICSHRDKR